MEHTSVQPSTDWGSTRADLLAHHSAVFRDAPHGDAETRAYVSTAQYVIAGQELLAEGLVINHGASPVTVRARVTTAGGKALAEETSGAAGAGHLAAAVVAKALDLRGGDHVFAVVDVLDSSPVRHAPSGG